MVECRHCGEVMTSKAELMRHLSDDVCGWKDLDHDLEQFATNSARQHDLEEADLLGDEWGGS